MKVIGLISGGKDSVYNLMQCIKNGHEIICLGHLARPTNVGGKHLLIKVIYQKWIVICTKQSVLK